MKFLLLFAFVGIASASAGASELIYQPINPTFGGNPLNATQLQGVASAQKPNQPNSRIHHDINSAERLPAICANAAVSALF